MRSIIAAAMLLAAAVPCFAAERADAQTPAVRAQEGQTLRGPNNSRIGRVERVLADGSVRVIIDARFFVVPANTISMVGGSPVTTLSRRDIARQN